MSDFRLVVCVLCKYRQTGARQIDRTLYKQTERCPNGEDDYHDIMINDVVYLILMQVTKNYNIRLQKKFMKINKN